MLELYKGSHLQKLARPDALWFSFLEEPEEEVWTNLSYPPWSASCAVAARLAYPTMSQLSIPTLAGFAGPADRLVVTSDHTQESLEVSKRIKTGDTPGIIVVSGLSQVYENCLTAVAGTVPKAQFSDSVPLIPAFAGSAVTYFMYLLVHSNIPVFATYWEQNNKPYLPMGVQRMGTFVED